MVLGTNVYVPDGVTNDVQCFDYATDATCANFPLHFGNLGLLYSVNADPFYLSCLSVNSGNGTDQIRNFDAFTGGTRAEAPTRVQASSFVAPSTARIPASFTSLQVVSSAPSAYTIGTVELESSNYVPIPGTSTYALDSTGTTSLAALALPTADALPQLVVSLTPGSGTSIGAVTMKITWTGTYSPACITSSATVTTATVPGSPTDVRAGGAASSAEVSWTTPASDGYSPITGYTVTARDAAGNTAGTCTASTPGTSCTVLGLTNGDGYTFDVVATNAIGSSPPAAGTGYVGTATPPGSPTGVSASAGNAQAIVTWTGPSSDGGSPVTGYTVTAYDALGNAAGTCTATALAISCTVRGLSNGHKQVGWRHIVLGRARFELHVGQKLTLHLIDTALGRVVLPRQLRWGSRTNRSSA